MAINFDWPTAKGSYNKQTIATEDPTTLLDDQQNSGLTRGCVLFVYSSGVSGTLDVYFIDRDNADLKIGSGTAVASGALTVIDFDYHLPRYKVVWTSDATTSSAVQVEVFAYGANK